jgi:hypothetical protein
LITRLHKRVCSDFKKFVKLELKSLSAGGLVIGARTVDVEQNQGSRLAGNLEKVNFLNFILRKKRKKHAI